MSYSTTNPPKLLVPRIAGAGANLWTYSSTDAATTVDASGYITNGGQLGMKVGDVVFVTDTDASPVANTIHVVTTVSSTSPGAVDLSTGVDIGSTNGD